MGTRTISTALRLDGEAEYKRQMAAVNGEIKTLNTELKLAEAQFKGQANGLEALTAKEQLLQKEIGLQNQKLEEAERALQQAKDAQAKFAEAIDETKQKAADAGVPLERLQSGARDLTDQEKKLTDELADQQRAYDDVTKKVQGYQQTVNRTKTDLLKFNGELEDTERYLDEAKGSADHAASSIDEFGRQVKDADGKLDDLEQSAKDAAGGLDGLKGSAEDTGGGFGKIDLGRVVGDLKKLKGVLVGGAVAGAAKEVAEGILDIEESTREYRQIMGTLETSSQAAGYSADETKAAYERLYGVLGDTQTSATTVANLQAIGLSQEDLMAMVDSCTGAWATYGDSIPIDSLAESVNETIKAGQVTGTFADVLNWGSKEGETFGVKMKESTKENEAWNNAVANCKSAEDYFNLALQSCQTESEKADLVLRAMAEQGLEQTGQAWRDNNEDVIKLNESQAKWEEATGKLGETLSPAADALRTFGADAVSWVADRIGDAMGAVQDFIGWLDKLIGKGKDAEETTERVGRKAERNQNTQKNQPDGSHAAGLNRVPYDGYVAELHFNEAVLNAREAELWRAFRAAGASLSAPAAREAPAGITLAQLQTALAGAVNAMNTRGQGAYEPLDINLTLRSEDGTVFGRWMVPYVRKEEKANPEVMNDA